MALYFLMFIYWKTISSLLYLFYFKFFILKYPLQHSKHTIVSLLYYHYHTNFSHQICNQYVLIRTVLLVGNNNKHKQSNLNASSFSQSHTHSYILLQFIHNKDNGTSSVTLWNQQYAQHQLKNIKIIKAITKKN